ncbi:hypothetical protein GLAREA_00461 [Glarea lozoyensis ATCC 20868]|uniref:2EXR domain-containing protein n=1 Tax=Glarea lozoyensis (strain ATCC 20868 / MF5171) TaxID=1116229 RepID=S3DBH7_GLAL2|nr:uncharacterized protein GLAREA_00461 [Glarea lozoyensis ATCC 20868]EPE29301.1 hypothetical protein GLAREA_00461 [Glarea lozoyensis ATCC 20868]
MTATRSPKKCSRTTKTLQQRHKVSIQKHSTSLPSSIKSKSPKAVGRKTKIRNFKLFTQLPIELRLKIWKYASESPRLIPASWKTKGNESTVQVFYELYAGPVPTVLQINRESRNEALRFYKQIGKRINLNGPLSQDGSISQEERLYINEQDTIYFIDNATRYDLLKALRAINKAMPLQRFAIRAERTHDMCHYYMSPPWAGPVKYNFPLLDALRRLPNLVNIIVTVDTSLLYNAKSPQRYFLDKVPAKRLHFANFLNKAVRPEVFQQCFADSFKTVAAQGYPAWRKFLDSNPGWKPPKFEVLHVKRR